MLESPASSHQHSQSDSKSSAAEDQPLALRSAPDDSETADEGSTPNEAEELAKKVANPISSLISQIVKLGKLPVNLQLPGQYFVEKPESGPDWGMRFQIQFPFPK